MTVTAFVDGKRVTALYVLLRHAAFFIDPEFGTFECTRVYVMDGGVVKAGDRNDNKIGPAVIERVELKTGIGLTIVTNRGVIWSPSEDVQATWVP